MNKVSIVDITHANKIQELIDDDSSTKDVDESDDGEDVEDTIENLGLIPRLFFSTFSMLTFLVPLVSTHVALDIIVHQQYAQDMDVVEIAMRAATAALSTSLLPACVANYFGG